MAASKDMTPNERVMRSKAAAHALWARNPDRAAHTAPARQAFLDRFEREVDPSGVLDPKERARRAENAKKAYYTSLALKSAQARRRRRGNKTPGDTSG